MLQISNIYAGYAERAPVLRDVSLSVFEHSVTALMGRNGVGKSTLCKCILGLLKVAEGNISFSGEDLSNLPTYEIAQLGIAYVPQGREVFSKLTVEENLQLAINASKRSGDIDIAWNCFPSIADFRNRRAGRLSGGEQQLVSIARALVTKPKFILLDEPAEGLHASAIQRLSESLMIAAKELKITLLIVEQNIELVKSVASTCAFLVDGMIVNEVSVTSLNADSSDILEYLAF